MRNLAITFVLAAAATLAAPLASEATAAPARGGPSASSRSFSGSGRSFSGYHGRHYHGYYGRHYRGYDRWYGPWWYHRDHYRPWWYYGRR